MIFTVTSIIIFILYVVSFVSTYFISKVQRITDDIVSVQVALRYINCTLLIALFCSFLLALQETGVSHPIGTYNNSSFISELGILCFAFSIVVVYNLRILRHISQPILTDYSIYNLDKYILYLRPFKNDNRVYGRIIKRISKKTFGAVSIADPHEIIQNVDGDKIFANDKSWKHAVHAGLEKAKFVILHIGNSNGCIWELQNCMEKHIGKCIFLISSKEDFDLFVNNVNNSSDIDILTLEYLDNSIQAYFLNDPYDINSWKSITLNDKDSTTKLIQSFLINRQILADEIHKWIDIKQHPIANLFNKDAFPEGFTYVSWCGLSMLAYPFIARLNWKFWILYLVLSILLTSILGAIGIIIVSILLTFLGKRMMYISQNWSGEDTIKSQINFMAIISLISTLIAVLMGWIYLQHYPIQPYTPYYF